MMSAVIRGFFTLGIREERYTNNRLVSIIVLATSNMAIGVYLYYTAVQIATAWSHDDLFRVLGLLLLLGALNTCIVRAPSLEESDFLYLLPLSTIERVLSRLVYSMAVSVWSFVAVSGLFWGWALHRTDVNLLVGLLSCIGLYLQMNLVALTVEHLLRGPVHQVVRGILVRVSLLALLILLGGLLLFGGRIAQVGIIVTPVSVLLGVTWYAKAAASTHWSLGLVWLGIGLINLVATAWVAWSVVSRPLRHSPGVEHCSRKLASMQKDFLTRNRSRFGALLRKDAVLLQRNWHVLVGALFGVVMVVTITVIIIGQSGQLLSTDKSLRSIMSTVLAVACAIGPGIVLTAKAYSEDHEFLWLIRLSCSPLEYVMSKFLVPFMVSLVLSGGTAVVQYQMLALDPVLWFLTSSMTGTVVVALGLWVGTENIEPRRLTGGKHSHH